MLLWSTKGKNEHHGMRCICDFLWPRLANIADCLINEIGSHRVDTTRTVDTENAALRHSKWMINTVRVIGQDDGDHSGLRWLGKSWCQMIRV